MNRTPAPLALALCTLLLQAGCHRAAAPAQGNDAPKADAAAGSPEAYVDLSDVQQQAIRIEAVKAQQFSLELGAVGSISFEEDPAIIQAESTWLAARANLDASHRELVRVQGLGEANGIAPREVEAARAAELAAAAAASGARDAVRALGVPDRELETLERTGRFAPARPPASATWVLINVPESDSPRVHPGEPVRVSVPAYPGQWFQGTVSRVYAAVDPATHRMALRAQVADPHHLLRPGMLADVLIQYAIPLSAVAIPATAAVREPDGSMIAWVTVNRSRFVARPLTLGQQADGRYQVVAGLKPDELVVTEGGVFLSNLLEAPPSD